MFIQKLIAIKISFLCYSYFYVHEYSLIKMYVLSTPEVSFELLTYQLKSSTTKVKYTHKKYMPNLRLCIFNFNYSYKLMYRCMSVVKSRI
jgi:hypothetical protein